MSFLKTWMRKGSSETPLAKRKREHDEGLAKQKERCEQEEQFIAKKATLKARWKGVLDPSKAPGQPLTGGRPTFQFV